MGTRRARSRGRRPPSGCHVRTSTCCACLHHVGGVSKLIRHRELGGCIPRFSTQVSPLRATRSRRSSDPELFIVNRGSGVITMSLVLTWEAISIAPRSGPSSGSLHRTFTCRQVKPAGRAHTHHTATLRGYLGGMVARRYRRSTHQNGTAIRGPPEDQRRLHPADPPHRSVVDPMLPEPITTGRVRAFRATRPSWRSFTTPCRFFHIGVVASPEDAWPFLKDYFALLMIKLDAFFYIV